MSSSRKELIRAALKKRLDELCRERVADLLPAASLETPVAHPKPMPSEWAVWEGDCLEALRRLSLGKALATRPGEALPVEPFLASLYEARRKPQERFRLLLERYACPLNIALDGESEAREHLLERLMVQDRALVESGKAEGVSADDVLLKLNLLAVYAARAEDLRYLDALNYYYELREGLKPSGAEAWLLASYLGLYAGALSTWLNRKL